MSAMPRSGVSERRLKKPVWMSCARSCPEPRTEKIAPWRNAKERKKSTNELPGNPGRRVIESSPALLTAKKMSGKPSAGTTFSGWRSVRSTERRATVPTWSAIA